MPHWVVKPSTHPVAETMTRPAPALGDRGSTVMARIDHATRAAPTAAASATTQPAAGIGAATDAAVGR